MFKKIIFALFVFCIALVGLYSLYGIGHFKYMNYSIENPKADFQIIGNNEAEITVVEFLNYGCGYCKQLHPTIKELLNLRQDIKYIARPVVFGDENMIKITSIVLAAGLQGKFVEMHEAILEYPEINVPDSFIEETASLYGLDYERLVKDSTGKEVNKIAENNLDIMEFSGLSNVPALVINGKFYTISDEKLPDLKEILEAVSKEANS